MLLRLVLTYRRILCCVAVLTMGLGGRWMYNTSKFKAWTMWWDEVGGHIHDTVTSWRRYVHIKQGMKALEQEHEQLLSKRYTPPLPTSDQVAALAHKIVCRARVVNNSITRPANYLTVNKGSNHGIKPGMGVITAAGVVGKVVRVSPQFATIASLLHRKVWISAQLKASNTLGAVRWQGMEPKRAKLLHVPRQTTVQVGEEVCTSGYNAIFPPGVPIGKVVKVESPPDLPFHNIWITLSTRFAQLSDVYLVHYPHQAEQIALEQQTQHRYAH